MSNLKQQVTVISLKWGLPASVATTLFYISLQLRISLYVHYILFKVINLKCIAFIYSFAVFNIKECIIFSYLEVPSFL